MFRSVAERRVASVMQQASEAQDLITVIEVRFGEACECFRLGLDQAPEAIRSEVHDAERMLEAVVYCAWVDQGDKAELANVPQALDPGMIDDRTLILGDEDGAVDGVADLVGLGHGGTFCSAAGSLGMTRREDKT